MRLTNSTKKHKNRFYNKGNNMRSAIQMRNTGEANVPRTSNEESQAVNVASQTALKTINQKVDSKEEIKTCCSSTSPAEISISSENTTEISLIGRSPVKTVREEEKTQNVFRQFFCCGKTEK